MPFLSETDSVQIFDANVVPSAKREGVVRRTFFRQVFDRVCCSFLYNVWDALAFRYRTSLITQGFSSFHSSVEYKSLTRMQLIRLANIFVPLHPVSVTDQGNNGTGWYFPYKLSLTFSRLMLSCLVPLLARTTIIMIGMPALPLILSLLNLPLMGS